MHPIYVPARNLDDNQRDIYDHRMDDSIIVKGCAGSGKTSLALLRMQQLIDNESNYDKTPFYYVTFVRELVECIRNEFSQLGPEFNDYTITYKNWKEKEISSWQRDYFHIHPRNNMLLPGPEKHPEWQPIRVNSSPEYLFVDECQDLELHELNDLYNSAEKGVTFYGDDDQHIMEWSEGRTPATLEDIQKEFDLDIYPLIFNYRLPMEIAMFAEQFGGRKDLHLHCKNDYHEKPVMLPVDDEEEALSLIAKRISYHNAQDVGIAIRSNEDVCLATKKLQKLLGSGVVSGSWNLGKDPDSPKRYKGIDYDYIDSRSHVKIMTYEKIKGRQFETVFLLITEEPDQEFLKRLYVGITRSERRLYILYTRPMPAFLRQIPISLYETGNALNGSQDTTPDAPESPELITL